MTLIAIQNWGLGYVLKCVCKTVLKKICKFYVQHVNLIPFIKFTKCEEIITLAKPWLALLKCKRQ